MSSRRPGKSSRRARKRNAAARPRKRASAKRTTAKRATRKRTSAKRAASKRATAKRATGKRNTAKRAAAKPKLRVVRRPVPRVPKSFPQTAGASSKQSVMFELMRARAALGGAIQGLTGGSAGEPVARGKWSVRQIVLHVGHWDREALRAIETALRGRAPEWLGWGAAKDAVANRISLAALDHHDWDSAQRLLHSIRAEFLEAIESVPDEPADVWSREHAFGRMLWSSAEHDRHHAEGIKRWRTGRPK